MLLEHPGLIAIGTVFVLIILFVLGTVVWQLERHDSSRQGRIQLENYEVNSALLIPRELAFYQQLHQLYGAEYVIMVKVHAVSFMLPKREMPRREWQDAYRALNRKCFDFLLCSPESLKPCCGIRLKLSETDDHVYDDEPFQALCKKHGLPLLLLAVDSASDPQALKRTIKRALA